MIRRDQHRREYAAFRTVFRTMADGSIEKKRYEILRWDAARLGEELSELPSSLYFVSIDAEENLREDLQNENSFVSVMVRRLGLALELHPDYAQKPIADLRKLLDSLCQNLEGPGAQLPEKCVFNGR